MGAQGPDRSRIAPSSRPGQGWWVPKASPSTSTAAPSRSKSLISITSWPAACLRSNSATWNSSFAARRAATTYGYEPGITDLNQGLRSPGLVPFKTTCSRSGVDIWATLSNPARRRPTSVPFGPGPRLEGTTRPSTAPTSMAPPFNSVWQ